MLVWLRSRERPGEVERRQFEGRAVTVGRLARPGIDLVIYDARIARLHCRFEAEGDGRLRAVDLNAPNGMFVNGRRLLGTTGLLARDQIYFHSGHTLVLEDDCLPPGERARARADAADPATPPAELARLARLALPEVAAAAAANPNCPPEALLELALHFYPEVQSNPAVGLLGLERPDFLEELRAAAASGRRLP